MNFNKSYEAGMAPPIGGVDSGGRRSDFSFTDMAAISGSWVSYIFTNLANFRTPKEKTKPQFAFTCFPWVQPTQLSSSSRLETVGGDLRPKM